MGDLIVIDRNKIEEWKGYFHNIGSDSGLEFINELLQQSQPLSEVIKPLLEDAWENGRVEGRMWENYELSRKNKGEYIQSILKKLQQ